jgi:hypothetical protein
MQHEQLRKNESLFTCLALLWLTAIGVGFSFVRSAKETWAKLLAEPELTALYPQSVIALAEQEVRIAARGTHFGPKTTVEAEIESVHISSVGFVSREELRFRILPERSAELEALGEIPILVRTPKRDGTVEELRFLLPYSEEPEPLGFDLVSFQGKDEVEVPANRVIFGYEARGYGPFRLRVTELETGEERSYAMDLGERMDQVGYILTRETTTFELELEDVLGREVTKHVVVHREIPTGAEYVAFRAELDRAFSYSGMPVAWCSPPANQAPASDCGLGNGPLGCTGCGEPSLSVSAPPNDYPGGLGEAMVASDGILLHQGSFVEDRVVDLRIPGRGLDFVWHRSYNSSYCLDGYLGKRWDFGYGASFSLDNPSTPNNGTFSRGDARQDFYDGASYDYTSGDYIFGTIPVSPSTLPEGVRITIVDGAFPSSARSNAA